MIYSVCTVYNHTVMETQAFVNDEQQKCMMVCILHQLMNHHDH